MTIRVKCPNTACQGRLMGYLKVKDEDQRKIIRCPKCETLFTIDSDGTAEILKIYYQVSWRIREATIHYGNCDRCKCGEVYCDYYHRWSPEYRSLKEAEDGAAQEGLIVVFCKVCMPHKAVEEAKGFRDHICGIFKRKHDRESEPKPTRRYYVYLNWTNYTAGIHYEWCSWCHFWNRTENCEWRGPFPSLREAKVEARSEECEIYYCQHCMP